MTAERYPSLAEAKLIKFFWQQNFSEMSDSFEEVDNSFREVLLFAQYVTELKENGPTKAITTKTFFNELKGIRDFFQRLSDKFFLNDLLFNLKAHDANFLPSLKELSSRLSYLQRLVADELGEQSPQHREITQIITFINSFISLTKAVTTTSTNQSSACLAI